MKIIIVGGGKVGSALCQQLVEEGHDIVVVDKNPTTVATIINDFDVNGILGNGVTKDVLEEADVRRSDLVIACTFSDELNILCCMIAKKLGAQQTIARVSDPEYFNLFLSNELGLNMMVNPDHEEASEIFRILNFSLATKVTSLERDLKLVEYKIPQDSLLVGKALKEIDLLNDQIVICNVQRETETFVPQGDFVLQAEDKITVSATRRQLSKFFRALGNSTGKKKNVVILGGNRIALYLAEQLVDASFNVTIFEKNLNLCNILDESLNGVKIINANGYDQNVLISHDISEANSVVAVSDDDEKNILISLFAASLGKKVIVKVDKSEYLPMLEKMGIDSVVSPKNLTANQIIKFVRALRGGKGGQLVSVYRSSSNGAEYVEFKVGDDFKYENVALKDLKLKSDTIIACIIHENNAIVPCGTDTIAKGDKIVVATLHKGMSELNDIFA